MLHCGAIEKLTSIMRGNGMNKATDGQDVLRRAKHTLWWLTKREVRSPSSLE